MLINFYYRRTGEKSLKRGKRGLGGEGEYALPVLVSALSSLVLALCPNTVVHERWLPIGVGDGGDPITSLAAGGLGRR